MVLVSDDNETFVHLVKQIHVLVHQLNKLTFDSHDVSQKHSSHSEDGEAKEAVKELGDDHYKIELLLIDDCYCAKLHNEQCQNAPNYASAYVRSHCDERLYLKHQKHDTLEVTLVERYEALHDRA